jgi:UDP-glucose 4-epimerase
MHVRSSSGDLGSDCIPESFDLAVNSAGRLGVPGVSLQELARANTALPVLLAEECARRSRPLLHLSTPGVAGLIGGSREDSPVAPWGDYERTKADAETALRTILGDDLLTIMRPDFVYGPGDLHKLSLFRQVARGWFPLVGSGRARIRPTHVRDVCRAALECLPGGVLGSGTWNIGGPEVVGVAELAAMISDTLGGRLLLVPVPRLAYGLAMCLGPLKPPQLSRSRLELFGKDHWVDISKASTAGFQPGTDLQAGLRETVGWYRAGGYLR